MAKGISTEWYEDTGSEEARKERADLVKGSSTILEVLLKIVARRRAELLVVREPDYDVHGWPFVQAHQNGRLEELDRLYKLLGSTMDHE